MLERKIRSLSEVYIHTFTDSPLAAKVEDRLVYAPSLGNLMGYSSVVQSLFFRVSFGSVEAQSAQ